MPKISVIVPIFKAEKYIERCVKSLTEQTFIDIEIILVDDKSPDKCPQICDEYALKDKRIHVIHKKNNEGAGLARNSGLEIATGTYISFVDSDDYIEPELYEHCYRECIDNNLDICYFRYKRIDEKGNSYTETIDTNIYELNSTKDCFKIMLGMMGGDPSSNNSLKIFPSVWSGLFNRETIKKSGVLFTSDRCGEDLLFTINLLPHTKKIKVLPDIYYNYFVNSNSLTSTYDDNRISRIVKLIKYIEQKIPNDDIYHNGFIKYILTNFKAVIRFESQVKTSIYARYKRISEICNIDVLKHLYSFPIMKFNKLFDRIFVFCMKHHISLFFIFIYNVLYNKYGLKK